MKSLAWIAALFLVPGSTLTALADDPKSDDGYVPMFNGKDLTGWVNVNCAPGTFYVKDGEIITTGKPTGYLRTTKQYENFIAEFEWMHVPPKPGEVGNSGFFVWADPIPAIGTGYTRGIEVQVLVNLTYKNKKGEITATSQGDLFSIWGATCVPDRPHPDGWARCLPSGDYCKGEREWNHYRVEANDGVIKLAVNGHAVSGLNQCKPRKGYLALESEGSECHFKNLKLKELPSTNPKPDEIADEDRGFKNLYTGLDLSGWKLDEEAKTHWQAQDTILHFDGKSEAGDHALRSEKDYADAEFTVDFRFPSRKDRNAELRECEFLMRDGGGSMTITIRVDGKIDPYGKLVEDMSRTEAGTGTFTVLKPAGQWNRLQMALQGSALTVTVNGTLVKELNKTLPTPSKGRLALRPKLFHGGEMDFANLFVRELK